MITNKVKYNKFNRQLYEKLSSTNSIKNLKYIKLNNNIRRITFDKNFDYIKILHKPSSYFKLNNKNLIKTKKKLKSGYLILSTPLGVMTDKKAILYGIGGTVLLYINKTLNE
ncbi:Ribosomal protein S8 family protein (apicoplast) [Theileria parva strain Muguga]|uniref:Ribosomal protein S8, putative n=1 Tax=Theileria parva TaxID=5875 RepID=Q4MYB2_THEPA|nr:Ribosomal protein S8 family protein [Theileria parva strain Muguga]|eukprot:XP_762680.1 ribosomal protein S8 (apicoplast) [Theileria parva strain Muguga]